MQFAEVVFIDFSTSLETKKKQLYGVKQIKPSVQ